MTTVTVNGNIYSDDGSETRDMLFGGHRTWFFPLVQDCMVEYSGLLADSIDAAADALDSAVAAAASAATAVSAPGTSATSTTSTAIVNTGAVSITIQTGKSIVPGMAVVCAYTTTPTIQMHGVVTSYDTGTGALVFQADLSVGSGTYALWTVSLSAPTSAFGRNGVVNTNLAASTTLINTQLGSLTYTPTTYGLHVKLPDATTCTVGTAQGSIRNASKIYQLGVRDASDNLLVSLPPGESCSIALSAATPAAGVWNISATAESPVLALNEVSPGGVFTGIYPASYPGIDHSTSLKNVVAQSSTHGVSIVTSASNTYSLMAYNSSTGVVGTPVSISTGAAFSAACIIPVSATSGIVLYTVSSSVKATGYTLSGTTLTLGSAITVDGGAASGMLTGLVLSGGGIVTAFSIGTVLKAYALTLSGSTVASGSAATLTGTTQISYLTPHALSATGFFVVSGTNGGSTVANSYTVSGTSLSLVSTLTLGTTAANISGLTTGCLAFSATNFALIWQDNAVCYTHGLSLTGAATIALTEAAGSYGLSLTMGAATAFSMKLYSSTKILACANNNSGSQYIIVMENSGSLIALSTAASQSSYAMNAFAGLNIVQLNTAASASTSHGVTGIVEWNYSGTQWTRSSRTTRSFAAQSLEPSKFIASGTTLLTWATNLIDGFALFGTFRGKACAVAWGDISGSTSKLEVLSTGKVIGSGYSQRTNSVIFNTMEAVQ